MAKLFFGSLKIQIILTSLILVTSAVTGVVLYMQKEMAGINKVEQYKNARNLLQSVQVSVENQYNSILFHRQSLLTARKDELQSVVYTAHSQIQGLYNLAESGQISRQEAQKQAISQLRKLRYKNGVGYIWINDTSRPYAKMIMHPIVPGLDGKTLDAPEFNCALGRDENLFNAFVNVVDKQGEGFVDYLWPKPTRAGLTDRQPKLSFVKEFKPWGWILGSGLYVDDLDKHVVQRQTEVLKKLNETFGQIRIADSGYIYIFTGKGQMIYHPLYKGKGVVKTMVNPATGNLILHDLMEAAKQPNGKIEYLWDKPQDPGHFDYKKIAFVSYFAPLDWYIGSSFYVDEVERPAQQLQHRALIFSLFFLGLALLLSLFTAHWITRPLQPIMTVFANGAKGDYSARLSSSRTDEFGQLAQYFNDFMSEIDQSHRELANSENRFRTLFEKSGEARLILEGNHFVECNEALVTMLGAKNKEDILNLHPAELSPEYQPDGQLSKDKAEKMIRLAYQKGSHHFHWTHKRINGKAFPAEIELTHIPCQDRKLLHVLWRDMTEQHEIEAQLLQSQKMEAVGTMAGGIAHDFNNILTAIIGYTELAQVQQDNKTNLNHNLQGIEAATVRARDLVAQILTFSRKSNQLKKPVDMAVIVREVLKLVRATIPTSIVFKTEINGDGQVLADPTRIHQIVMNLCTNAYHAMHDDSSGVLTVSLSQTTITNQKPGQELTPGEYLHLRVKDTGGGIDPETIPKIFEPYFTTKKSGKGTGLGLAVVHGIIKGYGGEITVTSEKDQGTTFHVYLPRHTDTSPALAKTAPQTIGSSGGDEHILFVDDEQAITDLAHVYFTTCGYTISCFNEPLQALDSFKDQPGTYDLLITDMSMPAMTGGTLSQELLHIRPELPIILCTGYSKQMDRKKALAMGIKEYLQKPVVMSKLVEHVQRVLRQSTE